MEGNHNDSDDNESDSDDSDNEDEDHKRDLTQDLQFRLEELRNEEKCTVFRFHPYIFRNSRLRDISPRHWRRLLHIRWTLAQSEQVFNGLLSINKSFVVDLRIHLEYCPLAAIPLLLRYLESSRHGQISLHYDPSTCGDCEAIQEQYRSCIGQVYDAIQRSNSVKKLTVGTLGECPRSIFDLLSRTKTLTSFNYHYGENIEASITAEMARYVAGGLAECSTSLKAVSLNYIGNCPLRIILSGIARSSTIQSLQLMSESPTTEFYAEIASFLFAARSLKALKVETPYRYDRDNGIGEDYGIHELLSSLQAGYSAPSLEKLELERLSLCSPSDHPPPPVAPTQNANQNLKVLVLDNIRLADPGCVRLLIFVGLKELHLRKVGCSEDDNHEDDWVGLIRRNPNLERIHVKECSWDRFVKGNVQGASGLKSLKVLELTLIELDAPVLHQLLKETDSLQELILQNNSLKRTGDAQLLVKGIREAKSLQRLVFDADCPVMPRLSFLTSLLKKCFLQNKNVKVLDFVGNYWRSSTSGNLRTREAFWKMLAHVLRVNKSLVTLGVPSTHINSDNMGVLVDNGLVHNSTLTSIEFSIESNIDRSASCRLVRDLPRMKSIEKVAVPGEYFDDEGNGLLLHAVQTNKKICFFERCYIPGNDPIDAQIEFFLKLNRLGRRILDADPNVRPASLWPLILSRISMASSSEQEETNNNDDDKDNLSALFFFTRECLVAINEEPASSPTTWQQQAQQPKTILALLQQSVLGSFVGHQSCFARNHDQHELVASVPIRSEQAAPPPCKRARLE